LFLGLSHGCRLFLLLLLLLQSSDQVGINLTLPLNVLLLNDLSNINSELNTFFHFDDRDTHAESEVAISDGETELLSALGHKLGNIKFGLAQSQVLFSRTESNNGKLKIFSLNFGSIKEED
jgi:hypothetical protein